MRFRTLHPQHPADKINVTPLIDVVMVLIIFYLMVGKMAADRRTLVELPASAVGADDQAARSVVVTITTSEGGPARVLVDGAEVSTAALAEALRGAMPPEGNVPVQVRADRRLPYSDVAPVIAACRDAGLTSIRLVTERDSTGGAP